MNTYRRTHAPAWAAAALTFLLCTACGKGAEASATETTGEQATSAPEEPEAPAHPAKVVASEILRCMKEVDAQAMMPLLNSANQPMDKDDIEEFLAECGEKYKNVDAITEVRAIPDGHHYKDSVWAKLYADSHETFALVLTLEGGKYLFEDDNSPGNTEYESGELLWP